MKIISIRRKRGRQGWVELETGERRVLLAEEVVRTAGLHPGDVVDEPELADLARRSEFWACRQSALNLLAHRARSRRELRDRLLRKKFDPEVVTTCLQELGNATLLDDEAFAEAFARDRMRSRPTGKSRILLELRAKGVDEATAARAAGEALSDLGMDELDLAQRAARKFRRRPAEELQHARRRLYGFLTRRGFQPDIVQRVLDQELPDES